MFIVSNMGTENAAMKLGSVRYIPWTEVTGLGLFLYNIQN